MPYELPDELADTAKSMTLAAVFWLVGTIIFLLAVYKVYQPKKPLPGPAPGNNPGCNCGGLSCGYMNQ